MRTDFSTVLSRYGLFTTWAVPPVRKQAAHGCERRGELPERARSLAVGYHMFRRPTTQHVSICNYISYGQPSDLYSVVVLGRDTIVKHTGNSFYVAFNLRQGGTTVPGSAEFGINRPL